MPQPRPHRLAYVAWVVVCLVWGTTYLGIRVALATVPPALMGGIRYTIAGVILALVAARGRMPPRSEWPRQTLLAFLMVGLGNGGVVWAEQWVPSGIAAVVVASTPFWINALDMLVPGGARLSSRLVGGLFVGFGGIVLLVWPDLARGGTDARQFALGLVSLEIACVGWSVGSILARRRMADEHPFGTAALQMILGGLIMTAAGTVRGEWGQIAFTPRTTAAMVYLTLVGSLGGYSSYIYALRYLRLSTVSLYAYVNPVIAVVAGTVLLGEPFGWRVVAAAALVLTGVAIVTGLGDSMAGLRRWTRR